MILTITKWSQEFTKTGAEYRKITGTTPDGKEVTKSVFDNLKVAWPLIEKEGNTVELKMVQKGQFWNVINIIMADEPWPEGTEAVKPEEVAPPKVEVNKGGEQPKEREIAPQERGMWWKQLGDDLRSGHIDKTTSHGKLLRAAYFVEMFRVLNIKIENKEDV